MNTRSGNIMLAIISALALTALPVFAQKKSDAEAAPKVEPKAEEPQFSVTPSLRYIGVGGNERKFRQDWWMGDGLSGGLEDFWVRGKLSPDWSVNVEGRALYGEADYNDYKLLMSIVNPKVGFFDVGFVQFPSYYDDAGGFFRPFKDDFGKGSIDRHRDLHVDNGRIWVDAGLTLPNWPKMSIGYEHDFKSGDKSLLAWGEVVGIASSRNIYPNFKHIDEDVDIFKAKIEHDFGKVHVGDQFRFERYSYDNGRRDGLFTMLPATTPTKTATVKESYEHDAFFNTFHIESHLTDKVYWSLAYLFTQVDGNSDAGIATVGVPLGLNDANWLTRSISVNEDSHVVSINTMFGPFFKGLSFYASAQAEKREDDGFSNVLDTTLASSFINKTRRDEESFDEVFGVRFTNIPFTTLYAEGKWHQGNIDLEQGAVEDPAVPLVYAFSRETDAEVWRENYRFGFNTSPLEKLTWSGYYRYSFRRNEYDNTSSEPAYPGFITNQKFITDEASTKLTLRPMSRLSMSLQYQLVATDYRTSHGVDRSGGGAFPAGTLDSGNFDSSIYSLSATVTPVNRLYLMGMVSYQDTRTTAFANGEPSVQTYDGNVISVLGAAGFAIDEKSDLRAEYMFSKADTFRDNSADGLPLGMDYQRHGLLLSWTRRIKENMRVRVAYGFYDYDDDANDGVNNYTAHMVSASFNVRF